MNKDIQKEWLPFSQNILGEYKTAVFASESLKGGTFIGVVGSFSRAEISPSSDLDTIWVFDDEVISDFDQLTEVLREESQIRSKIGLEFGLPELPRYPASTFSSKEFNSYCRSLPFNVQLPFQKGVYTILRGQFPNQGDRQNQELEVDVAASLHRYKGSILKAHNTKTIHKALTALMYLDLGHIITSTNEIDFYYESVMGSEERILLDKIELTVSEAETKFGREGIYKRELAQNVAITGEKLRWTLYECSQNNPSYYLWTKGQLPGYSYPPSKILELVCSVQKELGQEISPSELTNVLSANFIGNVEEVVQVLHKGFSEWSIEAVEKLVN